MTDILTESLQETCLMVVVRTTALGLRRTDKASSDGLNHDKEAAPGAGRVVVDRLPKGADDLHRAITKAQNDALACVKHFTLAFGSETSWRLLPNANFTPFLKAYAVHDKAFKEACARMAAEAPAVIAAAAAALGKFNIAPPTEAELRNAYTLTYEFRPVDDPKGFRGLPPTTAAKLQSIMERRLAAAREAAAGEFLQRFLKPLEHFVERMRLFEERENSEADGKERGRTGVFRSTVLTNLQEIIEVAVGMNVTGDPRIADLERDLRSLTTITPDQLRDNQPVRVAAAEKAAAVLANLRSWLPDAAE
jgi:hypothetical protein